jgi:hypothetical protein
MPLLSFLIHNTQTTTISTTPSTTTSKVHSFFLREISKSQPAKMHATTFIVALLAGLAAAAPAASKVRVELEIDNDTFVQKEVNSPGSIAQNSNLVSATVVKGNANCQAFNNGKAVGGTFNANKRVQVKKQKITQIKCN